MNQLVHTPACSLGEVPFFLFAVLAADNAIRAGRVAGPRGAAHLLENGGGGDVRLLAGGVAAGDDRHRGFDDTAVAAEGGGKEGARYVFCGDTPLVSLGYFSSAFRQAPTMVRKGSPSRRVCWCRTRESKRHVRYHCCTVFFVSRGKN